MKKWLNPTLIGLAGLCYGLVLTGDYFLPKVSLLIALALLISLGLLRLYLEYQPALPSFLPYGIGLGIVIIAAFLRFQTLKNSVPTANLANEAMSVLRQSNWQPTSFEQPPLYLYLASAIALLQLIQQASAGKISSPDGLEPALLTTWLGYVNILLGLLALLPTYLVACELWKSREAGAIATVLLATSWLAYAPTPLLTPQFLGALLLISSFYFVLRSKDFGDMLYGGILAGLAVATAYGSISLLIGCFIVIVSQKNLARFKAGLILSGGFLIGLTLGMPGWILSLNKFLAGLALNKATPPDAANVYFQQTFANDAGIVIAFGATIILVWSLPNTKLVLSVPIVYFVMLSLVGQPKIERLVLVMPFVAIAAVAPLLYFKRMTKYSGVVGLILIVVVSFMIRRLL